MNGYRTVKINGVRVRPVLSTLLLGLGAAVSLSAGPILILAPPGGLSGLPGSTVGWGFTITNDADYIEITSSQFCVNPVNFPLVCPSPLTGAYTDIISTPPEDIIVGPPGALDDPSSKTQTFDAIADTGIGSFAIGPGASAGDSDVGQIVLTYNLTDLDPNDPNAIVLGTDLVLSANTSVTVTGTPEPATAALLAVALLTLMSQNLVPRAEPAPGISHAKTVASLRT